MSLFRRHFDADIFADAALIYFRLFADFRAPDYADAIFAAAFDIFMRHYAADVTRRA